LQTFILPGTDLKKFGAKKGTWAVVTGASDGIGKEFAIQLGSAGFNVLLVASVLSLYLLLPPDPPPVSQISKLLAGEGKDVENVLVQP